VVGEPLSLLFEAEGVLRSRAAVDEQDQRHIGLGVDPGQVGDNLQPVTCGDDMSFADSNMGCVVEDDMIATAEEGNVCTQARFTFSL
jgi:hypothetical protein